MDTRIKEIRKHLGLSKTAFAKLIAVSHTAVAQWESGETKTLQHKTLMTIQEKTGFSATWIDSGKGPQKIGVSEESFNSVRELPGVYPVLEYNFSRVKVVDWPDMSDSEIPRIRPDDKEIIVPKVSTRDCFGLQLRGDTMTSMEGRSYPEGGIIVVAPHPPEEATPGDDVVVKLQDGSILFRRLAEDGTKKYLKALNRSYPPIYAEFQVLGRVVGLWLETDNKVRD